jgi:hypothetical protein
MRQMRNAQSNLAGRPEGKNHSGRPGHRWEDNTRMDLKETVWEGADCIHLTQDRDCAM